jgi:hypothetical protein
VARNRSGQSLINDAYELADNEDDQSPPDPDRHPRTKVLRYVNQGCAELYDLLVEARGRTYYRSASPWSFTTTADTTMYTSSFPAAFYRLISVRVSDGSVSEPLHPFTPLEEPELRTDGASAYFPTHYELRPTGIALLPEHTAGMTVTVEYIPAITDLTDAANSYFDGINGWEDYAALYAARKMATKDESFQLARELADQMAAMAERIKKLAPHRDAFRPRRLQDVRGPRMHGGAGGRRY